MDILKQNMTLLDHETDKDIINPYITIFYPRRGPWVALNSSTLGEEGQENLLHIFDEKKAIELKPWKGGWYKVCATVGKQNFWNDYGAPKHFSRDIRVEGANDAVALIALGYLSEDFIREHYPRTHEYFQEIREKESRLAEAIKYS